jgi:CDP-diacylglycerol--glycerol-3-phosphate 3-phosphatidyltransferase
MNLPNILSLLRIVLSCILPFLFVREDLVSQILAAILFIVAAVSDLIDGKIARKYNLITTFGKIIDPIADKMLVLGTYLTFAYIGLFSYWVISLIILREVLITVIRLYLLTKDIAVAAEKSGKLKTTLQIVSIGIIYFYNITILYFSPYITAVTIMMYLMYIALAMAIYITVYSGIIFFKNNWKVIFR